MAKMEQEIVEREEQIKEKDKIIEEYLTKYTETENNEDTDIPHLSRRIRNTEKILTENLEDKNKKIFEKSQNKEEQNSNNFQEKLSNSAKIIKSILKQTSTIKLKELLNEEIIKEKDLPPIFCRKTRQSTTLIIQSDTDNNTEKLLKRIKKIHNIS